MTLYFSDILILIFCILITYLWYNGIRYLALKGNKMKIIINYEMNDGIDLKNVLAKGKFICQVKTYSDYHDIFGKYLILKYPNSWYCLEVSIKVIDI